MVQGQGPVWAYAVLLGLATIGAYGTAYYAIGVLIPAIESDKGWSTSLLSGGFSVGLIAQGVIALMAGRVFDRHGSLPVLLPAISVGAILLFLASFSQESWQFVATWILGSSVIGGGLFYNVTMPIATRLYPENRPGALSTLTLLGALASPIFYPLAGLMIDLWGWQGALRGLVIATILLVAPAALVIRAPPAKDTDPSALRSDLLTLLREAPIARLLLVVAFAAMANSALILHQVPAIQAAGVSIAVASALAGVRGGFQIPGRLLLAFLTSRFGVRGSMGLCYLLASTAAVALVMAIGLKGGTTYVFVAYFCVAGGMSLGLLSPLNGLLQANVFGDARLGTLSGVSVCVASLASAAGAFASAALIEETGSYKAGLVMVVVLQVLSALALYWQSTAQAKTPSLRVADGLRPSESP